MADSGILNPSTGKNFEKAEDSIKSFTKSISEFIKSVDIASDSFDKSNDKAKIFAKQIQSAISEGLSPDEIASDLVGQLQTQLEKESKNITIPNLVKQLSKIGVGKEVTESISEWARQRNQYVIGVKSLAQELSGQLMKPFEYMTNWIEKIPGGKILYKMFGFDDIKKKIQQNITEKLAASVKEGTTSLSSLKSIGISTFESMGDAAKAAFTHPLLLAISLIVGALYIVYKQWNKIIAAAKSVRDETELTGDRAKILADQAGLIAERFTAMGVNTEVAGKAIGALVNEFQNADVLTKGMMENASLMVGALGVAPDVAAKTLRLFKNMGVETDAMQQNLIGAVANLSDIAGVSTSAVMKDIAESSKEIYTYFKGNVVNAAKAAIELRRMGTSLKDAANTSKNLLDFESNITSELEASVLAGTQLDFSRARYAAFTGDLVGSQKEILNQVKKISNFDTMNVFQKEAIAKASGMELGQLENMLQQSKELDKIQKDPAKKKAYDDAVKALEDYQKQNGLTLIQEKERQLAQEKMKAGWDNLIMKLSQVVFPIFDAIYQIVDSIGNEIQKMFSGDEGEKMLSELKDGFKEIGSAIAEVIPPLIEIIKFLFPIAVDFIKTFIEPFATGLKLVAALIKGDLSGALNLIPELLKGIAVRVLTLLTWPYRLALEFIDAIFGTNLVGILKKIIDGIAGVVMDILGVIIKPFKILYDVIVKNSIGDITGAFLSFFDFIKSLFSAIINIITFPFKIVLSIIDAIFGTNLVEIFNGFIELVSGIFTTLVSIVLAPFEAIISTIRNGFEGLSKFLTGWWDKIYNAVIQPLVDAWDFLFGGSDKKEIDVNVKDKSKEATENAPATATGGVVTSSQVRKVGEAGPEAIIPLKDSIINGLLGDFFGKSKDEDTNIAKTDNSDIIKKLDMVINAIQSMQINMDGKKVGEIVANATPNLGRA
jgi:phage-related protein